MKTIVQIIGAFLLTALLCQATHAASVKNYRNHSLGFEVSYLDNWEQSQGPGNPAFFIKRKSVEEPGSISISVANFTGDKDSFMKEIKAHPEKFIEEYRQRFPGAKMLGSGDTAMGGVPGYFVVASYPLKNPNIVLDIVTWQTFCIKGKRIYLISFETPLLLFEKTFDEAQVVLDTFNFR
ncbi:hypothetical protein LZ24_03465 [Desulfobotulus alkaliphilus]|uniref:PsbP protein n=1 Tax=Desulfobotulus alkaliphilus TaxID=622671 RepID=A0A562QW84_9BACT|nr:hypothetical protein [Desulfobotulus alkaliphilus]TWI61098.1 hypothetical protein LZ24_03465 [Desulfobotulus alkaliphilus]